MAKQETQNVKKKHSGLEEKYSHIITKQTQHYMHVLLFGQSERYSILITRTYLFCKIDYYISVLVTVYV
jgi:hypothetical protein